MAKNGAIVVKGRELSIQQAIDELGVVRAQRSKFEEYEKELVKELRERLSPGTKVFGERFSVYLVESTKRTIDAAKAFKKMGKEKFLKAASVSLTNAKKVLSEEDIDKIATTKPGSVSVRTDALTPAADVSVQGLRETIPGLADAIDL